MEIRQAEAPDFVSVHSLICELAAYEKAPNEVITNAEILSQFCLANNPFVFCWVCEIDEQIDRIAEMPYLFPKTEKRENVRKCLINKRVALFYKVTENIIFLLAFRSTHRNPEPSLY